MDSISVSEFVARFPAVRPLAEIFYSEKKGDILSITFDDPGFCASLLDWFCAKSGFEPHEIKGVRIYGKYKDYRYKSLALAMMAYQPSKIENPETRLNEKLAESLREYFDINSDILSKNVRTAIGLFRVSRKYKTSYSQEIEEMIEEFMWRSH